MLLYVRLKAPVCIRNSVGRIIRAMNGFRWLHGIRSQVKVSAVA
jgi:hypothetical protein